MKRYVGSSQFLFIYSSGLDYADYIHLQFSSSLFHGPTQMHFKFVPWFSALAAK